MKILNLSAIAASSALAGIAIFSLFTPAHAGEINLTCRQGSITTVALNTGDSIPLANWSVSDAIDVADTVTRDCHEQGFQANADAALIYSIQMNSFSRALTLYVQKETKPQLTTPMTFTTTPTPPQSARLW
jgi:hypothetical protein